MSSLTSSAFTEGINTMCEIVHLSFFFSLHKHHLFMWPAVLLTFLIVKQEPSVKPRQSATVKKFSSYMSSALWVVEYFYFSAASATNFRLGWKQGSHINSPRLRGQIQSEPTGWNIPLRYTLLLQTLSFISQSLECVRKAAGCVCESEGDAVEEQSLLRSHDSTWAKTSGCAVWCRTSDVGRPVNLSVFVLKSLYQALFFLLPFLPNSDSYLFTFPSPFSAFSCQGWRGFTEHISFLFWPSVSFTQTVLHFTDVFLSDGYHQSFLLLIPICQHVLIKDSHIN